jgi:hypothetical protein
VNIIKIINRLYDEDKLDDDNNNNNIEPLERLKTDVTGAYAKSKISDQHYANLKNELSMLYVKIYLKSCIFKWQTRFRRCKDQVA